MSYIFASIHRSPTTKFMLNKVHLFLFKRAARIEISPGASLQVQQLTQYAKLAGFDYVRFSSPSYIEVCVKLQDGEEAQIVPFPLTTLLAVPLPLGDDEEYAYPSTHAYEPRKPLLFDSTTSSNEISEHFKLHMFLSPGYRFLRLDPNIITLLEMAYDNFPDRFYIIPGSGYRPRSINRNNFDTRHIKEKYRFQMGQAVEIKPSGRVNDRTLFNLAIALMKASRSLRTEMLGIGVGAKKDRLYFHIGPLTAAEIGAIDVWDSGNTLLYIKLRDIQDQIRKGMKHIHIILNGRIGC